MSSFTVTQVHHIAQLANIPVSDDEATDLAKDFSQTLQVIEKLKSVDVTGVEPTHQVTGLDNVMRADEVETDRSFTQKEALANASKTHNGYFVVERIIDQD